VRVVSDPKTFDLEAFCEAVRTWAQQHPTVTMLHLMDAHDTAPDAASLTAFLAHPEGQAPTAE
jgi:hypothetical protein